MVARAANMQHWGHPTLACGWNRCWVETHTATPPPPRALTVINWARVSCKPMSKTRPLHKRCFTSFASGLRIDIRVACHHTMGDTSATTAALGSAAKRWKELEIQPDEKLLPYPASPPPRPLLMGFLRLLKPSATRGNFRFGMTKLP